MKYNLTKETLGEIEKITSAMTLGESLPLGKLPILVFVGTAYADGKIDKKELKSFATAMLADLSIHGNPLLDKCFTSWLNFDESAIYKAIGPSNMPETKGVDKMIDAVQSLKCSYEDSGIESGEEAILYEIKKCTKSVNCLPDPHGKFFKNSLLEVANHIASASGGIFGFGNKVSDKEALFIEKIKEIFNTPKKVFIYCDAFQEIGETLYFKEDLPYLNTCEYNTQSHLLNACIEALEDKEWCEKINNGELSISLDSEPESTSDLNEILAEYRYEIKKRNLLREQYEELSDDEFDSKIDELKEKHQIES